MLCLRKGFSCKDEAGSGGKNKADGGGVGQRSGLGGTSGCSMRGIQCSG